MLNDFLNPYKALYPISGRLLEYLTGNTRFPPWSVEIHPTQRCNFKCKHCSYSLRNQRRLQLDERVLNRLLVDLVDLDVKGVYFSGGGEPLLIPNICRHIAFLNRNGVEVAIITNGSMFFKARLLGIANMIDYIAISINSIGEKSEEITGVSSRLQKIILSIPRKVKAKWGKSAPTIGIRTVISDLNYREVPKLLKSLKELSFDYVLFKRVIDYEGRGLAFSHSEELRNIINKLPQDLKNEDFTNINKVTEAVSALDTDTDFFSGERCWSCEFRLGCVVNADGAVYPSIPVIEKEEYMMGNINNNSFKEIWNSQRSNDVIKLANEKYSSRDKECLRCRYRTYNKIVDDLIKKLPRIDPFV